MGMACCVALLGSPATSGPGSLTTVTPTDDPCSATVVLSWVLGVFVVVGASVGAHLMLLGLALVVGQVEVTKHLFSATFAPRSAWYCLDKFMPVTMVEACWCRLA